MEYRPLLVEVGVEDLPPGFVRYGREHIGKMVPDLFRKHAIEFDGLAVYGTPRRLAFHTKQCAVRQLDTEEQVKGPAKRVAYDADGNPTKAAIGFANSAGVPVELLETLETEKGEYVCARKRTVGKPTSQVVPEIISSLVESFSFPKMMRWDDSGFAFGRPVRSLLAILGAEPIDCTVFGVRSSNTTRGHWTHDSEPIEIADADAYLATLRHHDVFADQAERRNMISKGIGEVEKDFNCEHEPVADYLSILADSVESPLVFHGSFSARFLKLPGPVLSTCMWHHQYFLATKPKYFAKPSGGFISPGASSELLPGFIAVSGNPDAEQEIVRRGNEAVLEARLEDAAFFFEEDKKTPLEQLLPRLQGMALHKSLGDLLMKSRRLAKLAPEMASLVFAGQEAVDGAPLDEFKKHCEQAGKLCKADLVTHTVGEFPELQGVMGGIYAKHFYGNEMVAAAIEEHYRPRGADGLPPETDAGRILALADKLDSVCGFFGAGVIPKGSQDPFGLRREAFGVVRILQHGNYSLPLLSAIDRSMSSLEGDGLIRNAQELPQLVLDFIKQRLLWVLTEEEGIRKDLAVAVVSHRCDDIVDLRNRASDLATFSQDEQFEALTTGMKRALNVQREQTIGELDPSALVEPQEKRLFKEIEAVEPGVYAAIKEARYLDAFRHIASLRPFIDDFFDHVMVICEDEGLRQNRLALLARLTRMFDSIADFSKIVVERT